MDILDTNPLKRRPKNYPTGRRYRGVPPEPPTPPEPGPEPGPEPNSTPETHSYFKER